MTWFCPSIHLLSETSHCTVLPSYYFNSICSIWATYGTGVLGMSYKEKIPGHVIRREYIIQLARERLSVPLEELKKVVVEWSLGFSFLGSRRWMDGWHKIRKRICLFIGSSALKLDKWKVFFKIVTRWRHKSHLREGSSANLQPVRINTRVAWVWSLLWWPFGE